MESISPLLLAILMVSLILSIGALGMSLKTFFLFRTLTKNIKRGSLDDILRELLKKVLQSEQATENISTAVQNHRRETVNHLQNVGVVRFNPFGDTGGNQSFTLALLDGQGNGFVISSLHSRDQTRIYAKPVARRKGDGFELSKEEEQAITAAMKT